MPPVPVSWKVPPDKVIVPPALLIAAVPVSVSVPLTVIVAPELLVSALAVVSVAPVSMVSAPPLLSVSAPVTVSPAGAQNNLHGSYDRINTFAASLATLTFFFVLTVGNASIIRGARPRDRVLDRIRLALPRQGRALRPPCERPPVRHPAASQAGIAARYSRFVPQSDILRPLPVPTCFSAREMKNLNCLVLIFPPHAAGEGLRPTLAVPAALRGVAFAEGCF
jgi:hypothetical protein